MAIRPRYVDPLDPELAGYPGPMDESPLGADLDPYSDEALGLAPLELMPEVAAEDFDPGAVGGFLERFGSSFQGIQNPSGFAQGLASGLAGSLAGRGQQIAKKRAKFEASQAEAKKTRDAYNLQASQDYREQRAKAVAESKKAQKAGTAERKKYLDSTAQVTPEIEAAFPGIGRAKDSEGRVPREWLKPKEGQTPFDQALGAMSPNERIAYEAKKSAATRGPEGVTAVELPDGTTQYVPTSQAAGKKPASDKGKVVKPSPTEREALVGDIGILDQIGRARELFKPEFVGPYSGRYGGVTQATGLGKRKGEAAFRASVAGIRNQILKLRSGGAVSDGEAARLLQELPTEDIPSEGWEAKMDEFERTFRGLAETRRATLEGTGVDLSGAPRLPESKSRAAQEYAEYQRLRGSR